LFTSRGLSQVGWHRSSGARTSTIGVHGSRATLVAVAVAIIVMLVAPADPDIASVNASTTAGVHVYAPKPGTVTRVGTHIIVRWSVTGVRQSGPATVTRLRAPAISPSRCPSLTSAAWGAVGRTTVGTRLLAVSNLRPGSCYRWRVRIRTSSGRIIRALSGVALATAPAPTPTPTPPPAPLPPTGISVPSTINSIGTADASSALNAWLGTVPDGSTIVFTAGGLYRMDRGLKFSNRHNLVLDGNGATLKGNGDVWETSSLIALWGGNTGITIRNFNLVGNSSTPGLFQAGKEGAHGILVDGGSNIDVSNVTVSAVWGDAVYVGLWADGVRFHDSHVVSAGRNGVTIIAGRNVTAQRVAFDTSGYCTFDIEPNSSTEGASNIAFLNNTAGTWSNSFLSADGAAGSTVNGVTVDGNTVTGRSLRTIIDLSRRQNIVFTNNTSQWAAGGPVLRFAYIDGLTITGNVQPLTSGQLASIVDSTNVTYR
jgi:hypothetical protein